MSSEREFNRVQSECWILIALVRSQVAGGLWQILLRLRRSIDACRRTASFRPEVERAFVTEASRLTCEGFSQIERGRIPRVALGELLHLYSDLILSWSLDRVKEPTWVIVNRPGRFRPHSGESGAANEG